MSILDYLTDEPVRFSAAIAAFGVAVSGLVALLTTGAVAAAVGAVWASVVGIYNAVFVRNKVTPTPPPTPPFP